MWLVPHRLLRTDSPVRFVLNTFNIFPFMKLNAAGSGENPLMKLCTASAGFDHSMRQSSFEIFGALVARVPSCSMTFTVPCSIIFTVSKTASEPVADSLSASSPAVSSPPIVIFFCRMILPVSTFSSRKKVVTPVSLSPLMIAQLMGAAPLYRGRSEA
jgi:hypothetical protein